MILSKHAFPTWVLGTLRAATFKPGRSEVKSLAAPKPTGAGLPGRPLPVGWPLLEPRNSRGFQKDPTPNVPGLLIIFPPSLKSQRNCPYILSLRALSGPAETGSLVASKLLVMSPRDLPESPPSSPPCPESRRTRGSLLCLAQPI